MRDYKSLASGDPRLVAQWHKICDDMQAEEDKWIADLKASGVKAAHPDDGWVDRENNTVYFAYPQFYQGVTVGDIVALGWPDRSRLVRIIEAIPGWPMRERVEYRFEEIKA